MTDDKPSAEDLAKQLARVCGAVAGTLMSIADDGRRLLDLEAENKRLREALNMCLHEEGGLYALGLRAGLAQSLGREEQHAIDTADRIESVARGALGQKQGE